MTGQGRELDRLQRWMQSVITHPAGVEQGILGPDAQGDIKIPPAEIESIITRSQKLDSIGRLGVYANAYYARLLDCLRSEFPVLVQMLGQEIFDQFAFGYLQNYPSRSYTLARLGANFVTYLRQTRPDAGSDGPSGAALSEADHGDDSLNDPDHSDDDHSDDDHSDAAHSDDDHSDADHREDSPARGEGNWSEFVIDLATLEWAISEVFDGPGNEGQAVLQPEELRAIAPDRWPAARLTPAPCLRLLTFSHPVSSYYTAMRRQVDAQPPKPASSYLALTRRDYVVYRYDLSLVQHELLSALLQGKTVGQAIARAAEVADENLEALAANLQTWFRRWTADGFFDSVE